MLSAPAFFYKPQMIRLPLTERIFPFGNVCVERVIKHWPLDDLYQLLKHDQTNRGMMIPEANIVLLFVIDLVVLMLGLRALSQHLPQLHRLVGGWLARTPGTEIGDRPILRRQRAGKFFDDSCIPRNCFIRPIDRMRRTQKFARSG